MSIRLYLSSQGLGNDPDVIRPRESSSNHALIVLNALDAYPNSRQGARADEIASLTALGYHCNELDLRNYFNQPMDSSQPQTSSDLALTQALERTNLIWVVGGNTFVLARAMTAANFKPALLLANTRRIHQGLASLTYGGYSAGSVVAGIDLQGIDIMDDPDVIPTGYDSHTQALTLGLINDRIIPHYQSDNPESAKADEAVAFLEHQNLKYRALRDGEVWITHSP
jgi:dipeptidase E